MITTFTVRMWDGCNVEPGKSSVPLASRVETESSGKKDQLNSSTSRVMQPCLTHRKFSHKVTLKLGAVNIGSLLCRLSISETASASLSGGDPRKWESK